MSKDFNQITLNMQDLIIEPDRMKYCIHIVRSRYIPANFFVYLLLLRYKVTV